MKVISLCNSKGGVGKTTSVAHISAALVLSGKKVLMIDLDANRSLSGFFKINLDSVKDPLTAIDVISKPDRFTFKDAAIEVNSNLFLAPVKKNEANLYEHIFYNDKSTVMNLKKALSRVKDDFDYVLIDTPGSSHSVYIPMAIAASDQILVPIGQSDMDIEPTMAFISILDDIIEKYNKELTDIRFMATKLKSKYQFKGVEKMFDGDEQSLLCKSFITHRVIFERTSSQGVTIIEADAENKGAKDYIKLAKEIM